MEFIEFITDILTDGWTGAITGSILIACILFIVGTLVWGIFTAIDSWFCPVEIGTAMITNKTYRAAWIQVIVSTVGKVTIPTVIQHPAQWTLLLQLLHNGKSNSLGVTEKYYNTATKGDKVTVRFVMGRLSDRVYVKGFA